MTTPVFVFALFAGFLCELCGFGCFLPQRTRSRRKERKDLYSIHTRFIHPDNHFLLMSKIVILYLASAAFLLIGLLSISSGLKKESMRNLMLKVHDISPIRYGRFLRIAIGIFCLLAAVLLLFLKPKG